MRVVKMDQRNERAWMWLSAVVDDPEQQRTCLEYVLKINPENARARKGLVSLQASSPSPSAAGGGTTQHASAGAAASSAAARAQQSPAHKQAQQVTDQAQASSPSQAKQAPRSDSAAAKKSGPAAEAKAQPADGSQSGQHAQNTPSSASDTQQKAVAFSRSSADDGGLRSKLQQRANRSGKDASAPAVPSADDDARDVSAQAGTAPAQAQAQTLRQVKQGTATSEERQTAAASDIRFCCPYCGAATRPDQQKCPQCRSSLLVRSEPSERRSVALSFMGGLWGVGSIFFVGANFILLGQGAQYIPPLVLGIVSLGLAGAVLQRYRWAYIGMIVLVLFVFLLSIWGHFWPLMLPFLVLIPRSYRDFYGKKQRFVPEVKKKSAQEHYQAGVQYRERGMWFMAVQEWQAAVAQQPENRVYLQALGLAYAKLEQADRALEVLKRALVLKPDDARIQKVIQTIESYARNQT